MSTPPPPAAAFLAELKRRRVFRVAAVYAAVAFVIWQAADIAFPALHLPAWLVTAVVAVTLLGFPLALVLAWAFDITPDGVVRTPAPTPAGEASDAEPGVSTWRLAAGAVAVLMILGWGVFFVFGGSLQRAEGREPEIDRSVAVLPFENLSADPDNAFFATGMHHEIITQLSKIADLHVISRSSVLRYGEGERDLKSIAEALGVSTVMEGSVQRDRNRVRITAQLVDARNDRPLWAQSYDRDLSDIFAIQSEVALEIARQLNATLSAGERERIEQQATDRVPAYDLYLRAQDLYNVGMRENETAIELLKQAIQIDPRFAAAYALLGRAYAQRVQMYGFPNEWADSAAAAGRQAIALNPTLSAGHYTYAFGNSMLGRLRESNEGNRRAATLNPGDPLPYSTLARNARTLGQYDEAIRMGVRITALDPLRPIGPHHVGTAYSYLGDWAAAEQWLQKALELQPGFRGTRLSIIYLDLLRGRTERAAQQTHAWLEEDSQAFTALWAAGDVALYSGDFRGAARHFARLEQIAPGTRHPVTYISTATALGVALHLSGNRQGARPLFDQAVASAREEMSRGHEAAGLRYEVGIISVLLGNGEEGYRWLEAAVDAGWRVATLTRSSPALASIRGEPRFERLLARMEADLEIQRVRVRREGW